MRNTKNNRRFYGGAMPVEVEPHKFWPANEQERREHGFPKLSLVCRECWQHGLYGVDGKYRHRR